MSFAVVAQLVERVLGKDEVTGSIPVNGSRIGKWFVCAAEYSDGAAVLWVGFRCGDAAPRPPFKTRPLGKQLSVVEFDYPARARV